MWKAVQIHMYVIMYEITVIINKLILFETRNQGAIGHAIDFNLWLLLFFYSEYFGITH